MNQISLLLNHLNIVSRGVRRWLSIKSEVVCGKVDLEAVVGPSSKLEGTVLLVKGEPGDVNLASRLEDSWGRITIEYLREEKKQNFWPTWRNLHDSTIVVDNDFCGEGGIKVLIGAEMFSLTIVKNGVQ